jgi:Ca2+-binding RTX toxin-like protein
VRRVLVLAAVVALTLATFGGAVLAVVKDGGPGPDRLVGTVENDILRGPGGADEIIGKGDSDRLLGGRGNDFINARERGRADGDFVDCGAGRDTVLTDDTTEDTLRNCKDVGRG